MLVEVDSWTPQKIVLQTGPLPIFAGRLGRLQRRRPSFEQLVTTVDQGESLTSFFAWVPADGGPSWSSNLSPGCTSLGLRRVEDKLGGVAPLP